MILENDSINILAYNSETIFAEKLQAILHLKTANSRMKDYYDIFYFLSDGWTHLDKKTLINAIHTTFTNRNTLDDLYLLDPILHTLESDKKLNELWLDYQTVFFYSKNISFQDIINRMKEFSTWLNPFL
ncbi:putative nucleotidyltransferase component of viral defense system [Breznakia pachnodae]|uniref:Nucleotidyltransferase component of viral defense system n=1 Tax=Breznakia pachnodae TaxID=265178 RepID=A0ABU0DZZ2_9FIRM|nr:putative nucleotidyltransferase component of viral defense system [Breznakia pachnodae]